MELNYSLIRTRMIDEGGGTVTIIGGGFSEDVFNFGKPNHGNKVRTI